MATKKDYYCKDCANNNHGWCPIIRQNGLKDIDNCKKKVPIGYKIAPVIDSKKENDEDILSVARQNKEKEKQIEIENIKEIIKNNLSMTISNEIGLIPGSKKVVIKLKFDDDEISRVEFNSK